jgi:CDGSH-type Zn-finger protein
MSNNKEKYKKNSTNSNKHKPRVKITPNGPYIIRGNIPLSKMIIITDYEEYPLHWREVAFYPQHEFYSLCRCGQSKNKPYCDNTHKKIGFKDAETSDPETIQKNLKIYKGPELTLFDYKDLCVGSGFCTRAGNIWNLTTHSDNQEYKHIAIQQAADCPSGRLVLSDKQNNPIEPYFEPSIIITEDEENIPGPIWVRGNILIESSGNIDYKIRNRVTLCRCGKSKNSPLCDGSHLDI